MTHYERAVRLYGDDKESKFQQNCTRQQYENYKGRENWAKEVPCLNTNESDSK